MNLLYLENGNEILKLAPFLLLLMIILGNNNFV